MSDDPQARYAAYRAEWLQAWFRAEAERLARLGIRNQALCDVGLIDAARDQLLAEIAASP